MEEEITKLHSLIRELRNNLHVAAADGCHMHPRNCNECTDKDNICLSRQWFDLIDKANMILKVEENKGLCP